MANNCSKDACSAYLEVELECQIIMLHRIKKQRNVKCILENK